MNLENVLKREGNFLLTSTVTLTRGREEVVLVGLHHFGLEAYYHEIQEKLDKLDACGYVVMHETTQGRKPVPHPHPRIAQYNVHEFYGMQAIFRELREKFGICHQLEVLEERSHWVCADYSLEETLRKSFEERRWSEERIAKVVEEWSITLADNIAHPTRYLHNKIKKLQVTPLETMFGPEWFRSMWVLRRDRLAFTKILMQVHWTPVISYWGAVHLVGIGTMLEQEGFVHVDTAWHKALPLDLFDKK